VFQGTVQVDTVRFEQPQLAIRADRQSVHIEIGILVIGRSHDRGWRGHDQETSAFSDPIDVPMAVHDHRVVSQALQAPHKPAAIDQGRANALGGLDTLTNERREASAPVS
jgi:hypothetical protein